jgi:non-haem Fe2+, alpha-ketoglutarate-dependent halogenase
MIKLSETESGRFDRDGVVFPIRMFGDAEAGDWLARLEQIEARRAGRLPPASNAKPHLLIPWLWDIVHDERLVDAMEDILGPDILCYGSSFIIKNPGDEQYVPWHQDATYWGLSAPKAATAWIALTPSTAENGCVRMMPGTHREQLAHGNTRDPKNMLGRREKILVDVDENAAVDVTLAPGEISLHHPLIIHGSNPNRSQMRRVGFAVRYIPAENRPAGKRANTVTHVRGRDFGHYDLERKPEGEFHPAAVARHTEIVRRGWDTIFDTDERWPDKRRGAAGKSDKEFSGAGS